MGQKDGEKWTAAVISQPTLPKPDRLLDVHKDRISVAAAEPERAARLIGKIIHDLPKRLKVRAKIGQAEQLHLVYEVGPTGLGLQRALQAKGFACDVNAPSQISKRAGQLSAGWIPDVEDEAIGDLSRARGDAVNSRVHARQQRKGILLRHDVRCTGKTAGCGACERWLATLNFRSRCCADGVHGIWDGGQVR